MDTRLKNIKEKYFSYIIGVLLIILVSTIFLSLAEIKENYRYVYPETSYLNGELNSEIESYISKVVDYSLFYKSEEYTGNKDNITESDIEICKAEIREKIEREISSEKNRLFSSESFNDLSYEEQEKRLKDVADSIEDKYNYSDEELEKYVLNRKSNSYKMLWNELNSYKNLSFAVYDETNKMWINGEESNPETLKSASMFLEKINILPNGNMSKKIYINGKEIDEDSYYKDYAYYYGHKYYYEDEVFYGETKYQAGNGISNNMTIYLWIPKNLQEGDSIYQSWKLASQNKMRLLTSGIVLCISVLLLLLLVKYFNRENKFNELVDKAVDRIKGYPIEYKAAAGILCWIFYLMFMPVRYHSGYISKLNLESVVLTSVIIIVVYILIRDLYLNYKDGTVLKNNISVKVWNHIKVLMRNGSIFRSILLIFLLYAAIGGVLLILAIGFYDLFPICFITGIIVTIVFIVVGLKKLSYLEMIMDGAKDGAEGKLNYKIEERGQGRFRELAHNINNMKDGLKESLQNEVKSERMKTELITNVSHDLKTPLTSIINYIDLLKRGNISQEEARDYVAVLDNKAQRLKVLIEDLFEASKAASGAMELNIEKIEVVQLLRQSLGENDERIRQQGLRLKINAPEEKTFINADGKRLYRVFENLISNIIKYSLPNTRVYIDVIKEEEDVKILMKNIAAYELDFDVNEITERFKRADKARTSEGSGLGLAIAKSIIELHGGKFEIEVDGDLFKSVITLKH